MKALLLKLIYRIARQYFDKDMFDRIAAAVTNLTSSDMRGDDKRKVVRNFAKGEWKDVSGIVVDTIIQIVLLNKVGS